MMEALLERQEELYTMLDDLVGCEGDPACKEMIENIRQELEEIEGKIGSSWI